MAPTSRPLGQSLVRAFDRSRPDAYEMSHPLDCRGAVLLLAPLVLATLLAVGLLLSGGPARGADVPSRASDLFEPAKVWTLHFRFTPEQWAAIEPAETANFNDRSILGLGMALAPAVVRDGDRDEDDRLSADEFRALGARWFDAWDRDGDGSLDETQVGEGLRAALNPSGRADPGGSSMLDFVGSRGQRNGMASATFGVNFEYVHADLEFEGRVFPDVGVRYKGNGTFRDAYLARSPKRPFKVDLNEYVKGQKLAGVATINLHNNVTDAGMMNEVIAYRLYREAGVPAPRTAYARVFVTVPGVHERRYFGLYTLVENVDKHFAADRGLGAGGAILKPVTPDLFTDLGDDWKAYAQLYDPKTDLTEAQQRRVIELCRLVTHAPDEEFAARLGEFVDLDAFARFLAVTVWIGDLDGILTVGQNYYLHLDPATNRFRFIPWDRDHSFGSWGGRNYEERVGHSIREPWEGRKRFLERASRVEAFRSRYLAAVAEFDATQARPERIAGWVSELAAAIRPAVGEESPERLARFEAAVAGKTDPPAGRGGFGFGRPAPPLLVFAKDRSAAVADQLAGRSEGIVLGRPRPGEPAPPAFRPEDMLGPALMRALDADADGRLGREEFVGGFGRWYESWAAGAAAPLAEDRLRRA